MDLGIAGKKALVCGASAGLGYACAQALVREGVDVLIVARTEAPLLDAAERLSSWGGGAVQCVAADVTSDEGRARIFATQHEFDIVVTNAGGPPPGDFRVWDRDIWVRALEANMLAPIALIPVSYTHLRAHET
jgi:3-oxoacyl-[acyl-carrier protein] reductase